MSCRTTNLPSQPSKYDPFKDKPKRRHISLLGPPPSSACSPIKCTCNKKTIEIAIHSANYKYLYIFDGEKSYLLTFLKQSARTCSLLTSKMYSSSVFTLSAMPARIACRDFGGLETKKNILVFSQFEMENERTGCKKHIGEQAKK